MLGAPKRQRDACSFTIQKLILVQPLKKFSLSPNRSFIIAEIGNSHEGSLGLAKRFIACAAECGVDCVKLQTHIFDAESRVYAPNPPYFRDESRKEYFERTAFTLAEWKELNRFATEDAGVVFTSSAFSLEAVDLLEEVGVAFHKVPSGEVTNRPLLLRLAATGKPILLSSGMSTWEELDLAVKTLQNADAAEIVVLQCTSDYPCSPDQSGINLMHEMAGRYSLAVGFSDHTLGTAVPVAAVTLGACLVEKHFVLSSQMYGSDAANSTEPSGFLNLVEGIRAAEAALASTVDKDAKAAALRDMKHTFEKTICAVGDLSSGTVLAGQHLAYKKPMDGIPAADFMEVIGRTLIRDIKFDESIQWDDIVD